MDWPSECAVVIPCLNEAANIGPLVKAVQRHLPKVIVVDDGSTDMTAACAAEAGADVIRHQRSSGKGAALKSGWQQSRHLGLKWTLTMDGDGQHSAADIPRFLERAEQRAVLVVGDRMHNPGAMPWLRRVVNRWMSRRLSRRAGRPLPDSQCGFRLMRLDVLTGLDLKASHFEIESEVLLAFVAAGHRVEFVPVQVIYRKEQSKIHAWHDTVRWLRWFWSTRNRA
jgi:glycosyltransferase involved in cell wall biosynthesis